jgi:predicted flap endonuclease-1-like 5' DNA nuclease
MLYDISFLWIWLLLAFLLGGGVGWWTEVSGAQAPWFFGWFRSAVIAWLVGLVLAWLHWLPGRLGFWLESALLFFAFYVMGCLIGGLLRNVFARSEAAAGVGLLPGRQWPFRIGEGWSPFAGRASLGSSATPSAAAPVAPRASALVADAPVAPIASTVVPDAVVPPRASAVISDPAPAEIEPPATGVVPEPAPMGPVEGEEKHEGERPQGLISPRGGVPDDLKRIKGVGPQNEGRLHGLGIWHFQQIADWTRENVLWVGSYLAFPGRIDREEWIAQAKILTQGLETEFSEWVERGEVAKSHDRGTKGQENVADISKIKPHH